MPLLFKTNHVNYCTLVRTVHLHPILNIYYTVAYVCMYNNTYIFFEVSALKRKYA